MRFVREIVHSSDIVLTRPLPITDGVRPTFGTLAGAPVGIVGFGHIGRSIAKPCRALATRPVAVRGSARERDFGDPDAGWVDGMDALGELLDCPLTGETRGLIGAAELKRLGPAGILVGVAGGPVVDETALCRALTDGTIAGAALDAWHASAGTSPPFAGLDNVVMTPHYSASADNTYADRAAEVIGNLIRLREGGPLRSVVRAGNR
ncbi:NAD(P)-dependent oxidoreductase [Amycolatopsis alkalitolerans]|uniref:D-isomer specific 2-hydroxyacid dehydrogenase NAD-binding domain-containing protein n=1 Tax=Amycolatopsis alkalitolerans TaxID=2547244 RepID=A0A5C4LVY7_9PSEU|nr:NAD(P)-dependent oxidoreductase [Amycolatopsis alkalitolerans]TNC20571.1 hypothetical protein FG385_30575 [Amycolatopsis alkalitolerans]